MIVRPSALRALLLGTLLGVFFVGSAFGQEDRKLRHILVKNEAIADAIMKALEGGRDFKELARKYSLDVGTRPLGGDLDWGSPQSFEAEFSRAAFTIPNKGGYAKAKTIHGWHVVQYIDSRPNPNAAPVPSPQPVPGEEKPTPPPPVRSQRNEDLSVSMVWPQRMFTPEEPIRFMIEIENNTDQAIDVFNPELWPLGLIARYQFGTLNQQLTLPKAWNGGPPPGGMSKTLGPNEKHRQQFVLQDYFGERAEWPLIRMIWRGDTLFGRLEKLLPSVMSDEDYAVRKGRWRYYISEETRISVLPQYDAKENWYVCLFSQGRIWFQIHDPGIPGLMERLIEQVRLGDYDQQQINVYTPNDHFAVAMPRPPVDLRFQQPRTGIDWAPNVVGLGMEWDGTKTFVGSSLAVALGLPREIAQRAVPVGRIVHVEGTPIKKLVELLGDPQSKPKVSLALAYPESLLPVEVMEASKSLDAPRPFSRKINPTPKMGWKPGLNTRDDALAKVDKVKPRQTKEAPQLPLAKDLPRVEIVTPTGNVVVELYEDDAPNTVANFISLTEAGFYNQKKVVRKVETPSNRGFVQLGSPDNTATGHPGYYVADEVNSRTHGAGVLSMARKHTEPNTNGSQFFICLDAQTHLDGSYTAFGHVISGIENVDQLKRGSVIEAIRVLRKRDHQYTPKKLPIQP